MEGRASLGKTMKRKDVIGFCFGAVVGWGWIMLAGGWVQSAGTLGAIIALIMGGVMSGLVGLAYAELTPMLPLSGGEMVWAYRCGGYGFGWFTGWAICFAYIAVAAWEGPAFATAIDFLFPLGNETILYSIAGYDVNLTWVVISLIGSILIMTCHLSGMRITSILNTCAAFVLVAGGIAFFTGSLALGSIDNMTPLFRNGWGGIETVMMAAPAMYIGFDVIPQAAEEMAIPRKQIGWMVLFAIGMGAIWYIAMVLAVSLAVPVDTLNGASIPLASAASTIFKSKVAGSILIVAGIGGILTSWNAMFLGATRILFAMGRAKMLPPVFAKTNTKGAPVAAIILTGGFGMIAPFLGKNALGWFVDASSLGTVVAYLCVAISFIKLRHQEPNLERPWKAKRHRVIGILSLLACIFYISIYLPFGSSALGVHEWMMVGLWAFIGIIMYVSNIRQNRTITILDRETMIFGSHFSRKIVKDEPNAHLDSDIA